jgi:diguanylate cyclase
MLFAPKKRTDVERRDLDETAERLREQNNWFSSSARTLLYLLKAFALDVSDLDVEAFKKRIDKLVSLAEKTETAKDWNRALEADNSFLLSEIDRQKKYLEARDAELKGVIEFMHNSLVGVIGEGNDFTGKMHESSLRIEQIAGLDDIRRIKDGLKAEMSQMRQAVLEKEQQDSRRVESLSREIGHLRTDLEKAHQASMTDKLTGASNRLSFDGYIERAVERHVLSGARFSLLMCDLDDFKKINDSYGHQEGDCVLKAFVRECKAVLGAEDVLARYGGEEFAIMLPGASLGKALKKAQKICSRISSNRYLVESQGTSCVLAFTTSIGVAEVRLDDTVERLVDRADQALYMAKRTGKNRAVSERDLPADETIPKAA